jgi:hypothetical protein
MTMTEEIKTAHNRTQYVLGCTCEICKEANREYQRTYMKNWRMKKKMEKLLSSPDETA